MENGSVELQQEIRRTKFELKQKVMSQLSSRKRKRKQIPHRKINRLNLIATKMSS